MTWQPPTNRRYERQHESATRRLASSASKRSANLPGRGADDRTRRREAEIELRAIAKTWERAEKIACGAFSVDAGSDTLAFAFGFMAKEAYAMLDAHRQSPLEAAEDGAPACARGFSPPLEPSAASSGPDSSLMGQTVNEHATVPLDSDGPFTRRMKETVPPFDEFAQDRDNRIRLELTADALDQAISSATAISDALGFEMPNGRRVARELADYLRTVQAFARGEARVKLPPPEPQSLRVGPPLRLVKGDPAA